MFKSDILNIRKVRSEANIKFFEYFGQPNWTVHRYYSVGVQSIIPEPASI